MDHMQTTKQSRNAPLRSNIESNELPANIDALESPESRQAYDLLPELSREEWRRVHLVPHNGSLIQGESYFNLRDPARGEFVAIEPKAVHPDDMYVAKHEVDSEIWAKLQSKL